MKPEQTAQPKLYIGIDIHKRSWKIHCATDLFSGKSFTMPPKPEVLKTYVDKHFPDYAVSTAYEAGCCVDGVPWLLIQQTFTVREKNVLPKPIIKRTITFCGVFLELAV